MADTYTGNLDVAEEPAPSDRKFYVIIALMVVAAIILLFK